MTDSKTIRKLADEMWDRGYKDVSDELHSMAREKEREEKLEKYLYGNSFGQKARL